MGLGDWANRPPPVRSDDKLTTTTISTTAGATCMQNPFTLPATSAGLWRSQCARLRQVFQQTRRSLFLYPLLEQAGVVSCARFSRHFSPQTRRKCRQSVGWAACATRFCKAGGSGGREEETRHEEGEAHKPKRGKGGEEKKKKKRISANRHPAQKLRGGARPLLNRRVSKFFRGYGFLRAL